MERASKHGTDSRARKEHRLVARVTLEQKRLIERAAKLRGTTVPEFVIASAQRAAMDTINDFEVLTLRDEDRKIFVEAILNPPAPNKAALAARRSRNAVCHRETCNRA